MPEFVDSAVRDIDERLRELRDELSRLEAARSALTGGRRRPGRPRASATRTARTSAARTSSATRTSATRATRTRSRRRTTARARTRGATRGRNTRATQALELVRKQPGVTIPQLAEAMKIQPNYLYRVLPRLASEGQVKREGQGWHLAK